MNLSSFDEFVVASDHPALAGHFPGNPLVPGVLILDRAVQGAGGRAGKPIRQVVQVKFLSPLRSGEPCRLVYSAANHGLLRFECFSGERMIANGLLEPEGCR